MTDILKILTTSVRLLVTAGLIMALALRFDVGRAAELIRHADLRLIAAMLFGLLITNLVVGWRWQLILSAESASPGSATLLKIVFVGFFFNQVLPTGIGGMPFAHDGAAGSASAWAPRSGVFSSTGPAATSYSSSFTRWVFRFG